MDTIVTDRASNRASDRAADLIAGVDAAVPSFQEAASGLDEDGAFPAREIGRLRAMGALAAPLPLSHGGLGFGTEPAAASALLALLLRIGRGNLALGRVYEGHVNAIRLISRYGDEQQLRRAAADAHEGHLFALWNTEPADDPVLLSGHAGDRSIRGSKILASAAGFATRPVVTATRPGDPERVLVVLELQSGERAELAGWTAQGMRASATGRVRLDGLQVPERRIVGQPGDYVRQPDFSAGAWRTAAVTLGGLDALMALYRRHLVATGRGDDPSQRARLGRAVAAQESAHLWMSRAAAFAERRDGDPEETVAYVNLARLAVERACLDAMQDAQRSIGLAAFMRPNPIERIGRDLATYLRQPAPDLALAAAAGHFLRNDLPERA